MKKLMAITLLTILSTVCIFAQHGVDEQELIGLDKQWSAATDHKDSNSIDALNRITAADLTSSGGTTNKAPYTEPTFAGGLLTLSSTTLQVNWHSLFEEDNPLWVAQFLWGSLMLLSPTKTVLYFRWSTTEPGITSAEWQVAETQFLYGVFANNPNIIASGQLNEIPAPGQLSKFQVDFNQLLLQSVIPLKNFYVRIVPRIYQRLRNPSPSV